MPDTRPNDDIEVKVVDMRTMAYAILVDKDGSCTVRGTCSPQYIVSSLRAVIDSFIEKDPTLADIPAEPYETH
ncbi:hypothetical protein QNA23_10800 [Rhodococcus erythropolis]|uniref:hypothetical protein n=1 Tax=Rhodococcus erythropolis TaxID=1833 RepID=UPI0024BB0D99|nr:hypothetical protein [Rhodococcus erythropolis]MDJ0403971.1 hypothetical protein [Rhodococcus erythropolis]